MPEENHHERTSTGDDDIRASLPHLFFFGSHSPKINSSAKARTTPESQILSIVPTKRSLER